VSAGAARAGEHVTVLRHEAVAALAVRADGCYVDATYGRGGHTRALLAAGAGRVIALDRDPEAIAASAREPADARLTVRHAAFADLRAVLESLGLRSVAGVLFDLGVSSPQLDTAARGFSFRVDAPLDMRMDPTRGESAAEWLAHASVEEMREVIGRYGEERFAGRIATAIAAARARAPIERTRELADLVGAAVRTREPGQDPATRTFQAVRIHVNQELAQLALALPQAIDMLERGGRLAVISFHSLEDRIVKNALRDAAEPARARGPEFARVPLRAHELPQPRLALVGKPIRPTPAEVAANPRARSAILRVAEKL
jgi:16S rRNA (cytosine1402-N4)-methyltransferase